MDVRDDQGDVLVKSAEAAPSGRLGLSELFVNWSRGELFLRGYAFSATAAEVPGFVWEGGSQVFKPHAEHLPRADLQKSFPDCPTALCGFALTASVPKKAQLPLKGKLFVGDPGAPLRTVELEVTNRTPSFNANAVLEDVVLLWPWSDLFATGSLSGDASPVLRSVICNGVELDVSDIVLNKPKKDDGPHKRRPLDLRAPLRRRIGKAEFQVPPPVRPDIKFVFGKANSSYSFSVAFQKERLQELGVGHIAAPQYSTQNRHLRVSGRFFAHFDIARVELTINGVKQVQPASVAPLDLAAPADLELACDAPFTSWTWSDEIALDPAAPVIIEAQLVRDARVIARVSTRVGAGSLAQVDTPLAPSYYISPLRPVFDELDKAAAGVDRKMPVMVFVFPGDMSRTFGGGPSRVMSMAGYFRQMGFLTVLIDRITEGVATTACEPPLAEHFDLRLGIGRGELPELARMAFDAASRSETDTAMRKALAGALEAANGLPEAADLIRRREDPHFQVVAAYLLDRVKPDIVVANFAWTAGLLRMLPASVCKILDTHDIQHLRSEAHTLVGGEAVRADKAVEIEAWGAADYVVAIQAAEKDLIIKTSGRNNVILAGHAARPLAAARKGEPGPIVLFVGNRYGPNTEGLRRFLAESWPEIRRRAPQAVLEVAGLVGQDFPDPPEGVRVLGVVPDLAEVYERAAVVVNPVEVGTGLSIKVIEALCAGRAVVSTIAGMRGVEGEGVLQVKFEKLAEAIVKILQDPQERKRREAASVAFAATELTPDRIYRELFNTIELRLYK